MSKYNPEIEAYTNLLMKCVKDDDFFDEGLVTYLLNYKREIIEGYYFKQKESYGVIKSNLWGYIKNQTNEKKKAKWAQILNKNIDEPINYEYLKFNFYDRERTDRKVEYKPLYFRDNGKNDKYLEVSEEFLNIVDEKYDEKGPSININKLNETELKLIMNDCFNDNNINRYGRLSKRPGFSDLVERMKNHLINNYEEIEQLSQLSKKSFLRSIAMGNNLINYAFQSIRGKEREEFIQKHNLEEKLLTYMRYKSINKSYLIDCLYDYKDKQFWMKELNCFSKDKSRLSIKNMIADIIKISTTIENMYLTQTISNVVDLKKYKYYSEENEYSGIEKYKRIGDILNFFKEEIKSTMNYKEEMEKLMIVAIGSESEQLYHITKTFMQNEDGYQEDMDFKNVLYKKVVEVKGEFLLKMKQKEVEQLNEKLNTKLVEKGIKEKTLKI